MNTTFSFGQDFVNHGVQVWQNTGSINFTQLRSETPPNPTILIPFAHDHDFVERGQILDRIHQKCSAPDGRAALIGLGGVGKSQLAIEYAYRTHRQSPETWVFWVHASNASRLVQSFRDLADCAKIAGRNDPQANIFKLTHDWLHGCKNRWLLVLDSADDADFFLDSTISSLPKPLYEYIPHCDQGSILITTRNKGSALKLINQRNHIMVEPMDEVEAAVLFQNKLDVDEGNKSDVIELAKRLEYMPLAIVQAAAYISQMAPRCSVARYLDEYKKSDRKRKTLLNYDKGQIWRDREAKNSIIVTWQISFEYIRQKHPTAADLLSLMSFFDPQGMPARLLQSRPSQAKSSIVPDDDSSQSSVSGDESEGNIFEHDVTILRNFCFVSCHQNTDDFKMHALVQLAMRTWLAANDRLEQWKQQFVSRLCTAFPTGAYENWAVCGPLFTHALLAKEQKPEPSARPSLIEWATLMIHAAWYALLKGHATEAEQLALKSLKTRQTLLGQDDDDTLRSMAMVALVYSDGGRWDAAEMLQKKVIEKRTAKLGDDHPFTLISIADLASTYRNQGRWDEAEMLDKDVIKKKKTKLGNDHLSTVTTMANLASTYCHQGRWSEAETLQKEVIEKSKTNWGDDHPVMLTGIANLASIYWNQARWAEAEMLLKEVVEKCKTKLGQDHPHTLNSMASLASTYRHQGWWDEAEMLEKEVIAKRKTKLGDDHLCTLTSMGNLASTYAKQGRWAEAELLQKEVMEKIRTKLGDDHPTTLISISELASTYQNQGSLDEAETLQKKVIEMSKTKLGDDHPSTLTRIADLASTYWKQHRWDEAEMLDKEVINKRKTNLGDDHPATLTSIANLAATYWSQKRWDEAEMLQKEVIEKSKTTLGDDHPETLTSMSNLASTYWRQGRLHEAEMLEKEVEMLENEAKEKRRTEPGDGQTEY